MTSRNMLVAPSLRCVLCAAALAASLASLCAERGRAATTPGGNEFDPKTERETLLLSRSYLGGFPNGPSRNGVFSQDRQLTTLAAFESDASDIVPGDTNEASDVFVVHRRKPYDLDGPPWRARDVKLVSDGMRGAANGPSYRPDLDGDQRAKPRCVAFVSAASNLVPGDTNGKPDAFVRDLRTGRIQRVSVSSSGAQAQGTTYDVKLDGECGRVAFTSDAPNLALTHTKRPTWRSAITTTPSRGTRQVYVRVLDDKRDNAGLRGLTFLASASPGGRAGNAASYDVSFARAGTDCPRRCDNVHGEAVAFTSDASDLVVGDGNRAADVVMRRFERVFTGRSPSARRPVGGLRFSTVLVSRAASGRSGNGPSGAPAANDRGDYVAYQTQASDLLPGDTNGVQDVARAELKGPRILRQRWVSRSTERGPLPTAASSDPSIARPGSPIFFASDAPDVHYLGEHDVNGVGDVFFWNIVSRRASIQSRDSANRPMGFPPSFNVNRPPILSPPSQAPATSYYGNYLLFETANPLADLKVAERDAPQLVADPLLAALYGRARPRFNQVYLRYIGPR